MLSLLDPKQNKFVIDKNNWTVTLLRRLNKSSSDYSISLLVEKINDSGKIAFSRYDYVKDDQVANQFLIDHQEVSVEDPQDAKQRLSSILDKKDEVMCTSSLLNYQAEELKKNIFDSEKNPNKYLTDPLMKPAILSNEKRKFLENKGFLWARGMLRSLNDKVIAEGPEGIPFDEDLDEQVGYFSGEGVPYGEKNHYKCADIVCAYPDIERQFQNFKQAINSLPKTEKYQNIVNHLTHLEKTLENEQNSSLTPFILKSFTDFTNNLHNVPNEKLILHRTQILSDRLEEKAEEYKHKAPMSETLKSAICGAIGAIAGFVIGAAIGGPIFGAVLGGFGGIAGSSFGFFDSSKKNEKYKSGLKTIELANNSVNAMIKNNV